jgi:hypothetical protein
MLDARRDHAIQESSRRRMQVQALRPSSRWSTSKRRPRTSWPRACATLWRAARMMHLLRAGAAWAIRRSSRCEDTLRAGAIWAIRRSSSCEDLSHGKSRWLVNRVFSAVSHSGITTTLTSTFPLQQHPSLDWTRPARHLQKRIGGKV